MNNCVRSLFTVATCSTCSFAACAALLLPPHLPVLPPPSFLLCHIPWLTIASLLPVPYLMPLLASYPMTSATYIPFLHTRHTACTGAVLPVVAHISVPWHCCAVHLATPATSPAPCLDHAMQHTVLPGSLPACLEVHTVAVALLRATALVSCCWALPACTQDLFCLALFLPCLATIRLPCAFCTSCLC